MCIRDSQYAATKFILYTAGSSLFILLAALAMGFFGGGTPSFEYTALAAKDFGTGFQLLCYAGLLIAFGVKLPIVPLHTWLPDAHGEATAPVHMLLADTAPNPAASSSRPAKGRVYSTPGNT